MPTTSPEYERPPVVETVLGVQFDRLPKFSNAHLGKFWSTLDPLEWPSGSDAPMLEPQFERFGESAKWSAGMQIKLFQDIATRLQIRNSADDRMIQVQNNRLHLNWRGEAGNYPRYEKVRHDFETVLRGFASFVASESLGELRLNQWEVTYLNQIPQGTVWNVPNEWNFFRPLAVPELANLRQESFGGEWHFAIPEERGRLHVKWQHGLKADAAEQREMIVLTFTARGPITGAIPATDGLDLGHDVIVWSFMQLMSKTANDYWGLQHANP